MANIRSWIQIWPSFMTFFCIMNLLVLDFKIIAFADGNGRNDGVASESTCKNINYQSFLPPPYQNISNMICRPLWHSFELRVSSGLNYHASFTILLFFVFFFSFRETRSFTLTNIPIYLVHLKRD